MDTALLDALWSAYTQLARKHGEKAAYHYCPNCRVMLHEPKRCGLCLRPPEKVPWIQPPEAKAP